MGGSGQSGACRFDRVGDHAVREAGTHGLAIVNIYRLENGKVVEHWDVIQAVPETAANGNGMF